MLIKPEPEPENGKAIYAALSEFDALLDGLTDDDFIARRKFFRMGQAPLTVGIQAKEA